MDGLNHARTYSTREPRDRLPGASPRATEPPSESEVGKAGHMAKGGKWTGANGSEVGVMPRANLLRIRLLESGMLGNLHVPFGGGRMEKDAVGSSLSGRTPTLAVPRQPPTLPTT